MGNDKREWFKICKKLGKKKNRIFLTIIRCITTILQLRYQIVHSSSMVTKYDIKLLFININYVISLKLIWFRLIIFKLDCLFFLNKK